MHTGGHYTILRRNELEVHTETLTDLKNRALGEEKKRKKPTIQCKCKTYTKYYMLLKSTYIASTPCKHLHMDV